MSTLLVAPPHADSFPPPTMDEYITQQLIEQGYPADEEHVQKVWDYYERECLKAIESDTWIPYDENFWDDIDKEIDQRLQAQQTERIA